MIYYSIHTLDFCGCLVECSIEHIEKDPHYTVQWREHTMPSLMHGARAHTKLRKLEVNLLPLKHAFAKTSIYSLRDKEKKHKSCATYF